MSVIKREIFNTPEHIGFFYKELRNELMDLTNQNTDFLIDVQYITAEILEYITLRILNTTNINPFIINEITTEWMFEHFNIMTNDNNFMQNAFLSNWFMTIKREYNYSENIKFILENTLKNLINRLNSYGIPNIFMIIASELLNLTLSYYIENVRFTIDTVTSSEFAVSLYYRS